MSRCTIVDNYPWRIYKWALLLLFAEYDTTCFLSIDFMIWKELSGSPLFSWVLIWVVESLYRWKINVRWEVSRACASVSEWPPGNSSSSNLTSCRLMCKQWWETLKQILKIRIFFLFKIRKLHVASICEFNPPFRLEMIDKHEKVAATFHSAQ